MDSSDKKRSVLCFSQTGRFHLRDGAESEDVTVTLEKPGLLFYGLADGQSGKRLCRAGGEAALRSIARFIEEKGARDFVRCIHADELQYELIRVIRETLAGLCAAHCAEMTDFSSTIAALAIDPGTKEYRLIHLGDGAILAVGADKAPIMLSPPENGVTGQYTWLTSSPDAMHHLRTRRGSAKSIARFILLTDGATMLCRGKNIAKRAEALLCDLSNPGAIGEAIRNGRPQDDASCLVVDL